MLINRQNWKSHLPWAAIALLLLALASLWYGGSYLSSAPRVLPGGSSVVGLSLGMVAGLIFLFEFAYWPRRMQHVRGSTFMRWFGRAETWLRAHIWLGLLTLPLVFLHTGFDVGRGFNFWFLLLYFIVFSSGVFGLVMQQVIPRLLIYDVPGETIYSQIESVLQQAIDDAEHQLARLSGGTFVETPTGATTTVDETLLIGSPRRVGTVRSRTRTFEETNLELPNLEALESAWREEIRPYLSSFTLKLPRLEMPLRATEYFAELKRRVGPAAHELVDFLEQSCQQRRQFGRQKMLHFWLHGWLAIHLPLSIALMIFLVVHVITALRYSVDLW